jgi:hypothetical protein
MLGILTFVLQKSFIKQKSMDTLILYQKISDIKPIELILPYLKPSASKVAFNLKELELWYFEEFGIYVTKEKIEEMTKVKGGSDKRKITVIELDF